VLKAQEDFDARFLNYLLHSTHYLAEITARSKAMPPAQFDLPWEQFRTLPVASPQLSLQRRFADYLDRETACIDALITKKQRMIELLNNRFESSIFYSVTRGVRGTRPLQATNLNWLDEMPAGWGTPTVSTNFELQLGKMLNAEAENGADQFAYLRNINIQWDRIDLTDLATMHFSETDRRRCELRSGDVLICEGGEVGRAAVWNNDVLNCYFQKAIHRARPRNGANSRFLMYCLRSAAKMNVFAVQGNLSTIVHLTGEQLAVHRFPWPTNDEQTEIVALLDSQSAVVLSANQRLTSQIELLRERRQALITAAVTGELDVAGVAA
jgi:type I restriction enzyme S subunit